MGLSDSAIIVIVLVACLSVTALGAAFFRSRHPVEDEGRYNTSHEQGQYMRTVRMRNYGHLRQESLGAAKDLESRYTNDESSGYYQPHTPAA
ncbi:hypothetical protein N7462_008847 [Penicillium macrosclerotiorum]|uniref:uncharacterized protein n=1 Tax=Penicillium macrosclerotiorum TaxID=303699 RepID=UPI0025483EA7|nr:uncharacterized protein N7462_008847 [Penicillium macrosclerotiorum]KAJ5675950.1 hypothetical protein N7462_008847 [Penicillium macrosclerotiorum]